MNRKPRILYISAFDHPGAGNRVLVNWLNWLDKSGYSAYVAGPAKGWLREQLMTFRVRKILNASFFIPNKRNVLVAIYHTFALTAFIIRNRVDIIHCNSDQAYYMACAAARLSRRPIITHLRFHYTEDFYSWMFGGWRCPDMIILVSEAFRIEEQEKLTKAAPGVPVRVLHNCIDPDGYPDLDADRNQNSKTIFYPAAVAERKRQHQLYRLDALLKERGYSFNLVAAGKINDESYLAKCEKEASRHTDSGVRFLGHIDSVGAYYSSSFLSVSLSAYETFGYSVLESMMCGVPVTGYNVPAVKEILGEGGILVEQDNLEALADVISHLSSDKEQWAKLSQKARSRALSHFSPDYIVPHLLRFYENVINSKNRK